MCSTTGATSDLVRSYTTPSATPSTNSTANAPGASGRIDPACITENTPAVTTIATQGDRVALSSVDWKKPRYTTSSTIGAATTATPAPTYAQNRSGSDTIRDSNSCTIRSSRGPITARSIASARCPTPSTTGVHITNASNPRGTSLHLTSSPASGARAESPVPITTHASPAPRYALSDTCTDSRSPGVPSNSAGNTAIDATPAAKIIAARTDTAARNQIHDGSGVTSRTARPRNDENAPVAINTTSIAGPTTTPASVNASPRASENQPPPDASPTSPARAGAQHPTTMLAMSPPVLADILDSKRREIAHALTLTPLDTIRGLALDSPPPRNFFAAVSRARPGETAVIAEIKRKSPSAGWIRDEYDSPDFRAEDIARRYYAHGASAISCLTDTPFFAGDLDFIRRIRDAVPLPVLRKDFILDPWQVYESRAAGADAILLIAECLREADLIDLLILSQQLGMTVLLEVHGLDELLRVQPHVGFPHPAYTLLGINNRDLATMRVDLAHSLRLAELVDDPRLLVSESGIRSPADLARLRRAGISIVLVGEHLMRADDPGLALSDLLAPTTPQRPRDAGGTPPAL